MKTIEVKLTKQSIRDAINEIKRYDKEFQRKSKELVKKLASVGAVVASLSYSRAWSDDNDVQVSVKRIPNGYKIVANGDDVAFLEFGTGVKYNSPYPIEQVNLMPSIEVGPRTWSMSALGSKQLEHKDFWVYKNESGKHFDWGHPPAMGLYKASMEIQQNIERIAKEVFK